LAGLTTEKRADPREGSPAAPACGLPAGERDDEGVGVEIGFARAIK